MIEFLSLLGWSAAWFTTMGLLSGYLLYKKAKIWQIFTESCIFLAIIAWSFSIILGCMYGTF